MDDFEFTEEMYEDTVDVLKKITDNYTAVKTAEKIFDILGIDYSEFSE